MRSGDRRLAGVEGNGQAELVGPYGPEAAPVGDDGPQGQAAEPSPEERIELGSPKSRGPAEARLVLEFSLGENMIPKNYYRPLSRRGFLPSTDREHGERIIGLSTSLRTGRRFSRRDFPGEPAEGDRRREMDGDARSSPAVQPTRGLDVGPSVHHRAW